MCLGKHILYLWKVSSRIQADCRQCQNGGDSQPYSVTCSLPVDPKRHPRQDHDEYTRHIDLDQEVSGMPLQIERDLKNGVVTYKQTNLYYLTDVYVKCKKDNVFGDFHKL